MTGRPPTSWRWLPAPTLGACGAALAWVSWRRWPDILIDFGRELYVPWRLAGGAALYRDIGWIYGPLPPYFNAGLMRLFGAGASTLFASNLVLAAVLCLLLYVLMRRWTTRPVATICGVVFLSLFAFGHLQEIGNYNFIAPYAHALTHGVVLSVAAILVFQRYLAGGSRVALGLATFTSAAVFLCKLEVFVALAAALTVGWVLSTRGQSGRGSRGPQLAVVTVCFAAPVAACTGLLAWSLGLADAARGILFSWISLMKTPVGAIHFHRLIMGTDRPGLALMQVLAITAAYAAAAAGLAALERLAGGRPRLRRVSAAGIVLLIAAITVWWFHSPLWLQLFRPLPLVMLLIAAGLLVRILRAPAPDPQRTGLLVFTIFALLLMLKIILRVHFDAYGFALAMPATILATAAGLDWLPAWFARRTGGAGAVRTAFMAGLTAVIVWYTNTSVEHYRAKSVPFGSACDLMLAEADPAGRTVCLKEAMAYLERTLADGETFVVLPEGVMLNYLLRRAAPTPYYNFDPTILAIYGEPAMRAALEAARLDYVVICSRSSVEFGARFFGIDYAHALQRWVEAHYILQHQTGQWPPQPQRFGVAVFKRRPVGLTPS